MKKNNFNSESGISLFEILIVIVITGILVTFAVARFGQSRNNLQRQNVARELKVSFERARFDSVKRRASDVDKRARVTVDATSFDVTLDMNLTGDIEASDTRTVDLTGSDIRIVSANLAFPVTVKFDQRGQIVTTDALGNNVAPKFIICNGCTAATATPQNANVISISPTGTIVMTVFGDSDPTFLNPIVTAVGSGTEIRPLATYLPGSTSTGDGTATPTPTATPVPTPTLTPTPTPTPSPNATPTPTQTPPPTPVPTPTPKTCTRNQRPAQDNCVCTAPMFVRNNGKCQ
jgi:Tfp pilus assembly protein FimT